MTAADFDLYRTWDRISPIGDVRADIRSGIIASLLTQAFGDKSSHKKPTDFLIEDLEPAAKPVQTIEEQTALIHILANTLGGVITTNKDPE